MQQKRLGNTLLGAQSVSDRKWFGNSLWVYLNKSLWCLHSNRIYILWDLSVWFLVAEGFLSIDSEIIYLLITLIVTFTSDNVSLSQFKHLSVLCLTLPKIHRRIQEFFRRGVKDDFIRKCTDCIAAKTQLLRYCF